MSNEPSPADAPEPTSPSFPSRTVIALVVVALVVAGFSQLDRAQVTKFGPAAVRLHELFRPGPAAGQRPPLSAEAERFQRDVKRLGGTPDVRVGESGLLGDWSSPESFHAAFRGPTFTDEALAQFAKGHGDRLVTLSLESTKVTDAGLASLAGMTQLRNLTISAAPLPPPPPDPDVPPPPPPPPPGPPEITDAGIVHLRGLVSLSSLNLTSLPITDAGLEPLAALPHLTGVTLRQTRIHGVGLARWASLATLQDLDLSHDALSVDGLKVLAKATSLQTLSLAAVPFEPDPVPEGQAKAENKGKSDSGPPLPLPVEPPTPVPASEVPPLPHGSVAILAEIPHLVRLNLADCQAPESEIAALLDQKPGLKVVRW